MHWTLQIFDISFLGNEAPWTGSRYSQIEEKSNQMLGASVFSSGTDGIMVVWLIDNSTFNATGKAI